MITVYSDQHYGQNARAELIDGQLMPPVETPRRAEQVLAEVEGASLGPVISPSHFDLAPVIRVHDAAYVAFLETAWADWVAEHGDCDALPLNWPIRTMRSDRVPEVIDGKLSYYSFDAGTPLTSGTWQAITAAANVALTGQQQLQAGKAAAFALCRPPGHHAGVDFFGGYCFFNNAAIAAQALRDGGAERIAIFDVDYHHGNGTQAIFYDRSDILFVSIHADPSQEYPYFSGYCDEQGSGVGSGYTHNYPLRWGTDWRRYAEALAAAGQQIERFAPDALVVSLGVDTFAGDPISRFRLQGHDFVTLGEAIAGLRCPTLFVMEGGYALDTLGSNIVSVLQGFEQKI